MRTPTDYELDQLKHAVYDPVRAHEYYERTKKLKGRQKGVARLPAASRRRSGQDPRLGKSQEQISRDAKTKQRKELATRIQSLENKLKILQTKIREMEAQEASENRKSKAKKERAAKEKDKPKTAAEKAEAARESKQYRKKHRQELESKAKKASDKAGGGSSSDKKESEATLSDLKALATKVKGQIAVAKQKLAAI